MQKDKQKRLGKVVKELLKDPLQTTREIEEKTGVSKSTVANYISKDLDTFGQKDDRIVGLTDKDFNCIVLGVEEIERRLQDKEELKKLRMIEISQVIKENTARYTLFRGSATDKQGGLNNLSNYSDLELLQMLNEGETTNN